MSLSNELGAILADAERSLSPPTFDLTLAWRYAIWKALGPRDLQPGVIGEGHMRRAWLGILAAKQVLPIWERAFPADDRPRRMLDLAVRVIETGEQGPSEGDLVHFDEVLDELRGRDGRVELLAGYATIAAYRISVDDQEYELDQAPDPYYYDAEDPARDAAYAASSGAPFNKPSDPARRREFWTWWLREAVPTAAFSAVPYR